MVRVLATGTFDILHPGHLLYLSEARSLGDELYVIVARDSMIKHKQKPVVPEEQRLAMVQALRVVDKAILGSKIDIYEPLREIKPDIIALGANQFFKEKDLETQLRVHRIDAKVIRINSFRQGDLCSSAAIMRKVMERDGKAHNYIS
jgi:FAD synthetase